MLRDESIAIANVGHFEDAHAVRCERVHHRLKRIVKARGALDAQEAAALREADELRVWRRYGYASLIEYMELEMGYSPRAALERVRVANALVNLPQISEALTQGDLSFSAARELTRVATADTEEEWLVTAAGKNLREIEASVSGHQKGDRPTDPVDPALRTTVVRIEMAPEVYALWRQARKILEQERGERLDDNAQIAALCRLVIDGTQRDRTQPDRAQREGTQRDGTQRDGTQRDGTQRDGTQRDGTQRDGTQRDGTQPDGTQLDGTSSIACRTRAPYQVAVTVCTQCKRGWQDGAGVTVEMSAAAVERAQCDAEHIGSIDGDRPGRAKQSVPPAVRRQVLRRDHGTCRVPGCRSSRNIDVHHLIAKADGGTHELRNLICLCEAHHLALHDGSLVISGEAPNCVFTRRTHSRFAIEERAVATTTALRNLGFKRDEVRDAIARTRTHVGTADQSLEQWIKIALGYCRRPTS